MRRKSVLVILLMLPLLLSMSALDGALAGENDKAAEKLQELNIPNTGGELIRRSAKGDLYAVELLLDAGIDPDARNRKGETALIRSADRGRAAIIKLLLDAGADANAAASSGMTPLIAAAKGRHVEATDILLKGGADPNTEYKDGETALILAAQRGHTDVARSLVKNGANPNAESGAKGETPLFAATNRGYAGVVKVLLDGGAEADTRNRDGWTPLHAAIWHGHEKVVKYLLAGGAAVNEKFRDGQMAGEAPLMYATKQGRTDIARILLDYGADVNAKDQTGATCLNRAAQRGHTEIARFLLESGAEADGRSLREAASARHSEIARLVVEHGVDINEEDGHGISALSYAAKRGSLELVTFLLDNGANINPKRDGGWSALMGACKQGRVEIARVLLDKGADPYMQSSEGKSALEYAEEGGHEEIVRMIAESAPPPPLFSSDTLGEDRRIRLATTTSTDNSGLLAELLPMFEEKYGVKVDVIAVGTGKALKLGENGDVDLVLVHARQAEDEFVESGFGIGRRDVMYNDFIVVGPANDPARIAGAANAAEAFAAIARSGSLFVSRGDESGTHKKEKALWSKTGIPGGQSWYIEAGQGMGAVLHIADEKHAYTLTDRGTWIAFADKFDLQILFEDAVNLKNPYGIIAINPSRHSYVNHEGATLFIRWITSREGQSLVGDFKMNGESLFFPSAR